MNGSPVAPARWAIVGGGMLGLTLALRLAQAGLRVTVYEAASDVGGLAAPWHLDVPGGAPVVWDRHYHVTLLSDVHTRAVFEEIGVGSEMRWVTTGTGYYTRGRLAPVSNAVDFLRLPALGPVAKARLAATILHGSRVKDWRKLEGIAVEEWLTRWSGRATFERFWRPLLIAKLGDAYREANAAFIWATIQRLYAARRTGLKREMFGYVPGGYARTLTRFAEVLRGLGVELRTSTRVEHVDARPRPAPEGRLVVRSRGSGDDPARDDMFDDVVVTTTGRVAARLVMGLTTPERTRLEAIRYQGIVCASVLLDRPLSPYYLTYLLDDAPFTAIVEMTSFVDPAEVGGRRLVYLPKYVASDDPLFEEDDESIRTRFLNGLTRIHPFPAEAVAAFRISRVREVFARPVLGYSTLVPPRDTSVPGVHIVTSAQIVNGTLNVDETVRLAEAAARDLAAGARLHTIPVGVP